MNLHSVITTAKDTKALQAGKERLLSARGVTQKHRIALCVLLVGLVMMLSMPVQAAKSHQTREIPFLLFGNHIIVVTGYIGDSGPKNLMIDTGTNPSEVDIGTAQQLGLLGPESEAGSVYTVNGYVPTYPAVLSSLSFGPIHREDIPINIADLSWLRQRTGLRIDGVIGLDVLDRFSFQIDYTAKKIRFDQPKMSGTQVTLTEVDRLLAVNALVNGERLDLMVDTGGSGVVLFPQGFSERGGTIAPTSTTKLANMAGQRNIQQTKLKELKLGNITLADSTAVLADDAPSRNIQGILGISAQRFKRVTFDFEHHIAGFEFKSTDDSPGFGTPSCEASLGVQYCSGFWAPAGNRR